MASDTANPILKLLAAYDALLVRKPLATNMVMSGSISVTSDILRHILEYLLQMGSRSPVPDATNLGRQFFLGSCVVAPIATTWFSNLERLFATWNPASPSTVLCKMLCEQAMFAPFINTCFMTVQGLLEGRQLGEVQQDIREKFWTVQKGNMAVWAPANLVSYKFVAPRFRVLFSNAVAVLWMLFLIWKTSRARRH